MTAALYVAPAKVTEDVMTGSKGSNTKLVTVASLRRRFKSLLGIKSVKSEMDFAVSSLRGHKALTDRCSGTLKAGDLFDALVDVPGTFTVECIDTDKVVTFSFMEASPLLPKTPAQSSTGDLLRKATAALLPKGTRTRKSKVAKKVTPAKAKAPTKAKSKRSSKKAPSKAESKAKAAPKAAAKRSKKSAKK